MITRIGLLTVFRNWYIFITLFVLTQIFMAISLRTGVISAFSFIILSYFVLDLDNDLSKLKEATQ